MKGALNFEHAVSAARIELQKAQVVEGDKPLEALEHLLAAVRLDPENAEIALNLGRLELRLGSYGDALESLNRVLALGEDNAEVLGLTALCNFKLGHFDKAETRAHAALELDPGLAVAGEVLADCRRAQGAWAEALQEILKLLGQAALPAGAKARLNLKLAQCHLKLGSHAQAWEITQSLRREGYAGDQLEALQRDCEVLNRAEMREAFGDPGLLQRLLMRVANRHILRAVSMGRRGAPQTSAPTNQTPQNGQGELA